MEIRHLERDRLPEARALLATASRYDDAATVAEEKLFGPSPAGSPRTWGAEIDGALAGVAVASGRWLRLLAVAPGQRRRGLGSALLAAAEAAIEQSGPHARLMAEPGNYLAPGLDARDQDTRGWLERRGWRVEPAINVNLIVDLAGVSQAPPATADGIEIRRAGASDRSWLAAAVGAGFGAAWAFEVQRALEATPAGVHLAMNGDELAAFAAHDGNNRGLGWFGPAGTLPAHRGKGLGRLLLAACLADVATSHRQCEIAWIGPREFYQRTCAVRGERRFLTMTKDLS